MLGRCACRSHGVSLAAAHPHGYLTRAARVEELAVERVITFRGTHHAEKDRNVTGPRFTVEQLEGCSKHAVASKKALKT